MIGGFVYFGWAAFERSQDDLFSALWLQQMLGRLRIAEQRALPSWWLSTGLLEAAHAPGGLVRETAGFLCVLCSHALMMPLMIAAAGHRLLRHSYQRLAVARRDGCDGGWTWLDGFRQVARPVAFVPTATITAHEGSASVPPGSVAVVSIPVILRPVFTVLLLRPPIHYGSNLVGWMTAIGFMNLAVVGLILSTFTTRFVFPMISLEGQRFWILGTLPVDRRSILWSKFLFAAIVCCGPCSLLILLSDLALQLWSRTPSTVLMHQLLCLCLGVGLSGCRLAWGRVCPICENCHRRGFPQVSAAH